MTPIPPFRTLVARFVIAAPFIALGAFLFAAMVKVFTFTPPALPSCGFDDAGTCGGPCPVGEVCGAVGKTGCACMPEAGSPFCGFVDAGVCGGPCPVNQVCSLVKTTVCACVGPE